MAKAAAASAAGYYSREVKMPQTKKEGLENFLQLIINRIEAGESQEALLKAVDLLEDIRCGSYDEAMADAKGFSALVRESEAKHEAAVHSALAVGRAEGIRSERERIGQLLGVTA